MSTPNFSGQDSPFKNNFVEYIEKGAPLGGACSSATVAHGLNPPYGPHPHSPSLSPFHVTHRLSRTNKAMKGSHFTKRFWRNVLTISPDFLIIIIPITTRVHCQTINKLLAQLTYTAMFLNEDDLDLKFLHRFSIIV